MRWPRRALLVAIGGGLAACSTRPPPPPSPPEVDLPPVRRVNLVHRDSGERLDLVYHTAGAYDVRAMAAVTRFLRDRRADEAHPIDPALLDFVVDLLIRTGLPMSTEVTVLSGYRTAATNDRLIRDGRPAARESFHQQGRALDFRLAALPGPALAEIAKTMQRGGAAFYPASDHTHIDTGPVRTWKTA